MIQIDPKLYGQEVEANGHRGILAGCVQGFLIVLEDGHFMLWALANCRLAEPESEDGDEDA